MDNEHKIAKELLNTLLYTLGHIDIETLEAMVAFDNKSFATVDNGSLALIDPTYYRNIMDTGEYENLKAQRDIVKKVLEIRQLLDVMEDAHQRHTKRA